MRIKLGLNNLIKTSSTLTACLFLNSCATINNAFQTSEPETISVRIVDLEGKAKPLRTYVPQLNEEILVQNGVMNKYQSQPEITQQNQPPQASNNRILPAENGSDENIAKNIQSQTSDPVTQLSNQNTQTTIDPINSTQPKKAKVEYNVTQPTEVMPAKNTEPATNQSNSNLTTSELSEEEIEPSTTNTADQKTTSIKDSEKALQNKPLKKDINITKSNIIPQKNRLNPTGNKLFIQVGSYSSASNATEALNKNKNNYFKGKIEKFTMGNKEIYRVLVGPAANRKEASSLMKKLTQLGYKDAFIVKK